MTEQEAEEIVRRDIARALALSGRIAETERRAQERLRRKSTSPKNLKALLDAMQSPGIRSARDFNRSVTFKTSPRPQAPDTGGVTFHFSVTAVSKSNRTVAAYAGRSPSGSAEQHESYIERDGAAETFVDPESKRFDQEYATDGQDYIERPDASEKLKDEDGIIISLFGNIADTKEQRLEFWKKLEEFEQSPRGHTFTIDPFRGADFWESVKQHADSGRTIPSELKQAMESSKSNTTPVEVTLNDEDAISLLRFARSMGALQADGAIKVALGRGGRVQTRIIAELPHEITPAQRLAVAKQYCAEFERLGLPYWAVIHAPDKHNDRRNFHIHIVLSERPAKRMIDPATGKEVWDFEIVETYRTSKRQTRHHYPFAQNRIRTLTDRRGIRNERARWCQMLNSALEAAGSTKRYDPRSYKDMGLTQKAKKRIDPKIYAKERKGEATDQGIDVAREEWAAADHDLDQQDKQVATKAINMSNRSRASYVALRSVGHVESERFLGLIRKAEDLYSLVISASAAEIAANFVADKMVSRARLKKPAQRTKVDKILIEVASEIRATEGKQFGAIAERVKAEYQDKASQIAHIRADFARDFRKRHFGQLLDRMAPSNQSPGAQPRRAMSLEEVTAMTASLFPKHTFLSDAPAKPTPSAPKESAIDRYLGKNFFNPKNAGKKIDRTAKSVTSAKAPMPKETGSAQEPPSLPAGAQEPPVSPLQSSPPRHAQTQTTPVAASEKTGKATEARSGTNEARQACTPRGTGHSDPGVERDLPNKNNQVKTPVAATKQQEQPEPSPDQQVDSSNVTSDDAEELKERKKRKNAPAIAGSKKEQPTDDAAKREAQRRARIVQQWKARGQGD
jgi:hypothetical protein